MSCIDRKTILSMIPHQGAMCLWDAVIAWDDAGLTLRSYLVYLRVGEPFSPETYLLALQAGERTVSLQPLPEGASVQTAGEVNTAVPGVYCVDYTVTCGADAGRTRLLVVVEE